MSVKKEYLVKQKSLTGLMKWMNEESNLVKQTGTMFTIGDIQSYVKRGYLPEYLGNNLIERDMSITEVKLYNIAK
jgi:hypothetical protein